MVDNPVNPLNKLALDVWYKVLIPIGAIILIFSLVWLRDKEWFLFGFGLLLVGIGEWKNNKFIFMEQSPTAYQSGWRGNVPKRIPDKVGNLLLIFGIICIGIWVSGFIFDYHLINPEF